MQLAIIGEKTLRELGLTSLQARVYLSLADSVLPLTVKTITTTSKIARQDIYHILTTLYKLNLVEIVLGKPTMFRAIPLQEAITILECNKKKKMCELRIETETLLNFYRHTGREMPQQHEYQFILTPKKKWGNIVNKAIENTKECIFVIASWRYTTQCLFILHEAWEKALNKGVTIRWITEKKTINYRLSKITQTLLENPNFELRLKKGFLSPEIKLGIYDANEVLVATLNTQNFNEIPVLWTNNPVIICLLTDYFKTQWILSQKLESKKEILTV
jgi:sugar-specific transcriptional regulator TrmB